MDIIAFSVRGVPFYWYGIITSLAIVAGILITSVNLYWRDKNFFQVIGLLVYAIPIALLFSRLTYVGLHWALYQNNLIGIFMIDRGGVSIYGAFLGFILVLFFYTDNGNRRDTRSLSFWYWLDVLAPALVLGLAIDQLGHFILQATVGIPSNDKIAEYIEYAFRPSGFEGYEYFKPVALYQAIWQFFVLLITLGATVIQVNKRVIKPGNLFIFSLILICGGRFYLGFLYLTTNQPGSLHLGQIISLGALLGCVVLVAIRRFRPYSTIARRIFSA